MKHRTQKTQDAGYAGRRRSGTQKEQDAGEAERRKDGVDTGTASKKGKRVRI